MSEKMHQEYIGDGVYAWTDGYHIWLKADRDGQEHTIALEMPVFEALVAYEGRLRKMYEAARREKTNG